MNLENDMIIHFSSLIDINYVRLIEVFDRYNVIEVQVSHLFTIRFPTIQNTRARNPSTF